MDRKHYKCLLWKLLWGVGALSLALAWWAALGGSALGLPSLLWFWNALIFGILAVPIKLDCHACGVCGIGN